MFALLSRSHCAPEVIERVEQSGDYLTARRLELLIEVALHARSLLFGLRLQLSLGMSKTFGEIPHLTLSLGLLLFCFLQSHLKLFDLGSLINIDTRRIGGIGRCDRIVRPSKGVAFGR